MSAATAEGIPASGPASEGSIGILGAGRLGSALALALLARGYPRDRLRLAARGSVESMARLASAGLDDLVAPREEVAGSDLVIVAVRPQSVAELGALGLGEGAAAAFCVAGLRLSEARRIAGPRAARMMTSGPDTILEGRGVAAVCPGDSPFSALLERVGLSVARSDDESLVDAFTAAVCMPAALALMGAAAEGGLESLAGELPELAGVFRWAPSVLPSFASEEERAAYVDRMVTPGGVTERVVAAVRSGRSVRDAFYAGLRRAEALGAAAG
jgi:pyrroline-5-carboxylate reductase